jgi:hypothetical protein
MECVLFVRVRIVGTARSFSCVLGRVGLIQYTIVYPGYSSLENDMMGVVVVVLVSSLTVNESRVSFDWCHFCVTLFPPAAAARSPRRVQSS